MRLSKDAVILNSNYLKPLLNSPSNRLVIISDSKSLSHRTPRRENVRNTGDFVDDFPRISDGSLTLTVTPELEEQIVGDNVGQKFMLKQALSEIIRLEIMLARNLC